jgi:hypothetical protein
VQPTVQLATKNHASNFASLAVPPQKYAIIEVTDAAASLGATEALAVGKNISRNVNPKWEYTLHSIIGELIWKQLIVRRFDEKENNEEPLGKQLFSGNRVAGIDWCICGKRL